MNPFADNFLAILAIGVQSAIVDNLFCLSFGVTHAQ